MNFCNTIIILYLILTLLISFIISFLYLNYFRNKELTSPTIFYICVFCFGLIIYYIFLVLLDHSISCKTGIEDSSNLVKDLLNYLEIIYSFFGIFSLCLKLILIPMMIFLKTTGFYNKCDILQDIIKSLLKKYLTIFNVCTGIILLIPIFVLIYLGKLGEFYENEIKLILNYLNYYSYLRVLFYIGFIIQNYIRMSCLKKDKGEFENYNIWKLGKLYLYYWRDKYNIKKNYDKIKNDIEKYFKEHPEDKSDNFMNNVKNFQKYVKFSLENILYVESDKESIKLSSEKYKKYYRDENIENENLFGLNKHNEVNENIILYDENIEFNEDDNINYYHENNNLEYTNNKKEYDFLEKIAEKFKRDFKLEENKNCNCFDCCNCCKSNNDSKDYKNFKSCKICECCNNTNCCWICCCCFKNNFIKFKIGVCSLMGLVYKSCVSLQRKSFLIDQKYLDIKALSKEGIGNPNCFDCCNNCCKTCIWILLIIFLLVLELPFFDLGEIYDDSFNKEEKYITNIIMWIFFFISVIIYFLIFNYSIIHHQYLEGDLLFGKEKSQNVNYLNFIHLMYSLINPLLFHSVWVLNKSQTIEAKFSKVYILKPIYVNDGVNIVPYISITFILICIYNTVSFSKLKLCEKNIFIFNENTDFYGLNENFYGNFLYGCGCLIFINKYGRNYKRKSDLKDIEIDNIDKNDDGVIKLLNIDNSNALLM